MRIVPGLKIFQSDVYPGKRRLFKKLARGQSPDTLYITCSDSRIDLSLIMQTEPGELFIVHYAGNIIPPLGSGPSGELASIEFVVAALGIKLAVVCGHSNCGAMKVLLDPETLGALPWVAEWLE
jgi:carbonic anhydrase